MLPISLLLLLLTIVMYNRYQNQNSNVWTNTSLSTSVPIVTVIDNEIYLTSVIMSHNIHVIQFNDLINNPMLLNPMLHDNHIFGL